jgi:hypothetical protein
MDSTRLFKNIGKTNVVNGNNGNSTNMLPFSFTEHYEDKKYTFIQELDVPSWNKHFGIIPIEVHEKLMGRQIRLIYNGEKTYIGLKNDLIIKDSKEEYIIKIFNAKHFSNFTKIIKKFGISFVLFGEFVENNEIKYFKEDDESTFVFFDLYVNSNWLDREDFYNLMLEVKLPFSKPIYTGEAVEFFDKILPNFDFISKFSNIKNEIMEGIIVRQIYDFPQGEYNGLTTSKKVKVTYPKFIKPTTPIIVKPNKEDISKKLISEIEKYSDQILQLVVSDEIIFWWRYLLNSAGIEIVKTKFPEIIRLVAEDFFDDVKLKSALESHYPNAPTKELEERNRNFVKRAVGKKFPSIVRNKLGLV